MIQLVIPADLINKSLITNYNANFDNIISVSIPAMDVYGNVSIDLGLVMPHSGITSFTQVQKDIKTLNVKYRLEVTKSTGESSYVLTSSNFVGSATIYPLQYVNIESTYPNTNVSNFLKIPGQAIHLNLSVTLKGVEQNIFDLTRQNYTWYWIRNSLDSSLQIGSYAIKLLWTGLDGSARSVVATSGTVYNSVPTEFSKSLELTVSYTIEDLTTNITVLSGQKVTLKFKVVVPSTGVAWDRDLNVETTSGDQSAYNPVGGEYSVTITAPALSSSNSQVETVTLQSNSATFINSTLTYMVVSKLSTSTQTAAHAPLTDSKVNVHISLIGIGYIAIAIVAVVVYAGGVFYFMRRK